MELTSDLINKRYKIYISKSSKEVELMEQVVMNILDRNYDLLYDYFCNVLDRQEEYKVLRARRCQVLFQIFLPIILKNEPNIQIHGTFLSSHAVAKYKDGMLQSSVLILDDIVIHGRGLQELYEDLDAKYEHDNIHLYVHKIDRNADVLTDKLKEKLKVDSKIFDWEWRELSTQLVNAIQATVTPYVSFIETYVSSQNIALERIEDGFEICDNTNEDQKRVGTKAYVFFEKEMLPRIIQNGGYDACVRYYENKRMKKAVYVPYVFMKSLSKNDINFFCTTFAEKLVCKCNALRQELLIEQDSDLKLMYKAYLVNVLLNRIYGLYLNEKYQGVFDFSTGEWSTLAMCFGNAVAEDIEGLVYDDIRSLMTLEFCKEQYDIESREDSVLVKGLKEALKEEKENEILPLYFCYNRQLDEESVRRREKRRKGLSIKTFYSKLGSDIHRASRLQLKCWDAGTAACDTFVTNNVLVSLYARAGEQSFRYIIDKIEELRGSTDIILNYDDERRKPDEEKLENRLIRQFLSDNKPLYEWKIPKIYF